MPGTIRDKVVKAADTFAGIDPRGGPNMPRTGTDRSSKLHFLALFLVTLAIMAIGLTVAFTQDDPDPVNATPSIVVTATPTL